jgi:TolB-like protein/Tfp pilus assembly protein PilF
LGRAAVAVDVAEFERLAGRDGDDDLGGAIALYRGPFLDGLGMDGSALAAWIAPERARLHAIAMTAALKLAARRAACGDWAGSAAALDRALALDPLSEEAHRARIRLEIDRGAFNRAIRRYRDCADILKRELGTVPEPATTALYREALGRLQDPAAVPAQALAAPPAPDARTGADAARRASIAVMPLVDRTSDGGGRAALADGLVDDLITRLAKLRCLFVIARGSVFALAERRVGAEDAGRALQVDYVVGGSVRRQGVRAVVTIELTDTRSARIIWAEVFDHRADDAFLVLDEIGNRIVAAIAGEIEMAERNRAILKPPGSLDAWETYHRGLWHMYRFTRGDNEQGQQFFETAVRLDPTFARAYAGLSFTHFQKAFQFWGERAPEVDRAFAAACQGLMVDDRDPAAHWAMGRALWLRGDQDEALLELERAVDLSRTSRSATTRWVSCNASPATPAARSARPSIRAG